MWITVCISYQQFQILSAGLQDAQLQSFAADLRLVQQSVGAGLRSATGWFCRSTRHQEAQPVCHAKASPRSGRSPYKEPPPCSTLVISVVLVPGQKVSQCSLSSIITSRRAFTALNVSGSALTATICSLASSLWVLCLNYQCIGLLQ